MIDKLVHLVVAVIVVGLLAWLMSWAMASFGVPPMFQNVAWLLFALIVILAVIGLLGFGPLKGPWRSPPP